MGWLQTSNNKYQEAINSTGLSISPWRFVYNSGYNSSINLPTISVVSDYGINPAGLIRNEAVFPEEITHILTEGVITFNTSSHNLYDKVYCDNLGRITFNPTPIFIGVVIEKGVSGKIFININYSFLSQINNPLLIDSEDENAVYHNMDISSYNYIKLLNTQIVAGIGSGFLGRVIIIQNISSKDIYFKSLSELSNSFNRLYLPNKELILQKDQILQFIHTGENWILIGGNYRNYVENNFITLEKNSSEILLGSPVYIDSEGEIKLAINNSTPFAKVTKFRTNEFLI
jgi:hypothetical protein